MKTSRKCLIGAAGSMAILAPLAVAPAPVAADSNSHSFPICSSGGVTGYVAMANVDDPILAATLASPTQTPSCADDYLYSTKVKYKRNGEIHYEATPWSGPGAPSSIQYSTGYGTLFASCHGYRFSTSQAWNYTYLSTPNGQSLGTHDCDDHGAW